MRLSTDRILPDRLPALCRLLVDGVGVPSVLRTEILDDLVYWWERSPDKATLSHLQAVMQLLADSPIASELAAGLLRCVDRGDDFLVVRTIELLRFFTSERDTSVPILSKVLKARTGIGRWSAAKVLAELGLQDEWIIKQLGDVPDESGRSRAEPESARVCDLDRFRTLYSSAVGSSTPREKGKSLEDLAEYMFLSVPGLHTIARNLRTLAEEIDLAFSNNGDGFWRQIGDPFIVECKNRKDTVDAATIRDFRVKLQTKGLRGGFIVTTSQLTKDARLEIRQALADGRTIVAVEKDHLAEVANGKPLPKILSDCFYRCRLL